ncbi:MAG TPA: hypothetical protein VFO34_07295 [Candidatus Acidoferrales bacterium]|nr:hypothetical protein [Candidatus Acidoferrales bacterium]
MRLSSIGKKTLAGAFISAFALAAVWISAPALSARSQQDNPVTMSPDANSAKARALLQQMVAALGGDAYLKVRDSDCTGRRANFGLSGDLTGYILFHELRIYPDKSRLEYAKNAAIIDVFNGDSGWSLDKSGVGEADPVTVAGFQGAQKTSVTNLIRTRLNEPGLSLHYAGSDVVDLKPVDWLEITDSEDRTFRIAIVQATHLPVRCIVVTKNPATNEPSEDLTIFSEWHLIDGVQTPFQISRERDGKRYYQGFYLSCHYNTGVSPDLFTQASLQQRANEKGIKPPKKKN